MKSRETRLRLMRFEAEEKARKVQDLEMMIRDFMQITADLERQIAAEEDRSGIKDANHYAYSTFAKAAAQRKENIETSVHDLTIKLDQAKLERDDAKDDLEKNQAANTREINRDRRKTETKSVSSPEPVGTDH